MRSAPSKPSAWPVVKALLAAAAVAALLCGAPVPGLAQTSDLVSKTAFRVCADPANYPMSDDQGRGFENRLAEMFAEKLGLPVEYTWYPMATGFVRNTLRANRCDVIIGFAQGHELVLNTNHYFTSTYVLIVDPDGPLANVEALSDPALQGRALGVVAGTPPASHMARYGLMGKALAYDLMVDRRYEAPGPDMLAALRAGEIDGAILWGPIGGPLVKTDFPEFKVIPLVHEELPPRLFYRITMGVRLNEKVWQRQLNSLIRRHQDEINAILHEAGVPLVDDYGKVVRDLAQ
ncbi:quinoprotein dehydrogenase-associated putative ABC transporter substrate-binding protein [Rhodovulum strictum]|uniref:Quinoprotein dehydrogenase-associated putative ABC transporter substrate-binding protein n=1 Tax=Rhodovulum strictum TaxID=58314 RepID=A0A844B1T6_9RHOB|nr:quinoprotein dehydrogenase-associated putative ABC transporter substrate-binding protein [Rhodovulum strictum]